MSEDEAVAYAARCESDPSQVSWVAFIPLPASQIAGAGHFTDWIVAVESLRTGNIICLVEQPD